MINKIFFFCIWLFVFGLAIILHEATHKQIAEIYGCENIKNYIGIDGIGITRQGCDDNLPQAFNEIVGYGITYPLAIFTFVWLALRQK